MSGHRAPGTMSRAVTMALQSNSHDPRTASVFVFVFFIAILVPDCVIRGKGVKAQNESVCAQKNISPLEPYHVKSYINFKKTTTFRVELLVMHRYIVYIVGEPERVS